MIRILAVGLVTIGLVAATAATPAYACGCGGIVSPAESDVSASSERAIVSWADGIETIELTFDIESDSPTVGLIIPTPSAPVISAGDLRTFDLIESVISPNVTVVKDWWGIDFLLPDRVVAQPDTLDRVPLGPIKTTTMGAADTISLNGWLAANGFTISEELLGAMTDYGDNNWSITLITLSSADVIDGHIDPIRLSFKTAKPIYPMRLARSETTQQQVRLYMFDNHRNTLVHPGSASLNIEGHIENLFAGPVTDSRLTELGTYLSAFDVTYSDPKSQASSDIGFAESANDSHLTPTVIEYRPVTLVGIPLGTLLVAWALVGAILMIAHVHGRRRAR